MKLNVAQPATLVAAAGFMHGEGMGPDKRNFKQTQSQGGYRYKFIGV